MEILICISRIKMVPLNFISFHNYASLNCIELIIYAQPYSENLQCIG